MSVTCRNVEHLYDGYIDGELSAALTAEVQAHLLQCPECQRKVEFLRAAGNVIATDRTEPSLSQDFARDVLAALPQAAPAAPVSLFLTRRQRRQRWVTRAVAGFWPAVAAMLAVAALILPPSRPTAVSGQRLVAGRSEHRPVDTLGVRSLVAPTLTTLTNTGRMASNLQGLYEITLNEARTNWPAAVAIPNPPPSSAGEKGVFMELLHPFVDMLTPTPQPQSKPTESADVVRF